MMIGATCTDAVISVHTEIEALNFVEARADQSNRTGM